jgi:hypothetical protein
MGTAVSAPGLNCVLERAIQRCSGPPFPLLPVSLVLVVLPAGAGAPRDFMAPLTCGELSCQASPEPASARLSALTWNDVRVFTFPFTCLAVLRGDQHRHRDAERATKWFRALLDARSAARWACFVCVFDDLCCQREEH